MANLLIAIAFVLSREFFGYILVPLLLLSLVLLFVVMVTYLAILGIGRIVREAIENIKQGKS